MRKRTDYILLCSSVLCYFVMALSILLMFFDESKVSFGIDSMPIILGAAFWASFLGGGAIQLVLYFRYIRWYKLNRIKRKKKIKGLGLITFFKKPVGISVDIIFITGVIALIIYSFVMKGLGLGCYVLLAISLFFFFMHCIFNGKIFLRLINQDKLLALVEKKRERKLKEKKGMENG